MTLLEADRLLESTPLDMDKLKFMQMTYKKASQEHNIEIYNKWTNRVISDGWIWGRDNPQSRAAAVDLIFKSYCDRAKLYFHDFLIAIEFYKPYEKKFYEPRMKILNKFGLVQDLQDLHDRVILGLAISMPPRTGKSELEKRFIAWIMAKNPEGSTFFASHTNPMANKFYREICMLIEDPSYSWKSIFPGISIVERSAEDKYIDIGSKETYKSFYSRGIDGNMSGILEANELLCCDDLIKDSEEARNPDRVKTAVIKYAEDIKQRRKNEFVRELHIGTRWATMDVIGLLQIEHGDDPRWRFRNVPAIDDNGNSNFMYDIDPMTVEHFDAIKRSMFMVDGTDISFNCIFQQNPADRQGILFPKNSLDFYDELPEGKPDRIILSNDIAWGGKDYYSAPLGKIYNDTGFSGDVYIDDVIHVNYELATKDKTRPRVVQMILNNRCNAAHFEANNGGDEYADRIRDDLESKGFRCNVTDAKVPTNRSKNDRIVSAIPEIKAINPNGYKFHFKRIWTGEYAMFMRHLTNYNQSDKYIGKQADDAPDALSSMAINMLGCGNTVRVYPIEVFDRSKIKM